MIKKAVKKFKNYGRGGKISVSISIASLGIVISVTALNFIGVFDLDSEKQLNLIIILLSNFTISNIFSLIDSIEEIKKRTKKLNFNSNKFFINSRKSIEKEVNLEELFKDATEVCILGIANTGFLKGNGITRIKDGIDAGIRFKIISLSPNANFFEEYEESGIISETSIPPKENIDAYLKLVKSLENREKSKKSINDMIELKVTTYLLPYSMMIVKKNKKISVIKVDMYGVEIEFMDRRSFFIEEDDEYNINFFLNQWNCIWNSEKTISVNKNLKFREYNGNLTKTNNEKVENTSYSGTWESEIYDEKGNIEKQDILNLVEEHGKITGEMKRVMPEYQNDRKWLVLGFAKNAHILLSIIAKDEKQASDGSVYVILKDDNTYEGFYLKKDGYGIKQVPICLKFKKDA